VAEVREMLRALYEARQAVEEEIATKTSNHMRDLDLALAPLRQQSEVLDRQMNVLLGEQWSWIEGQFAADGLPELINS
jgi:hypothetical protein